MLIMKHTVETIGSLEAIWNIWQDIKNWNTWDPATEYSSINGPFKTGTKGSCKFKNGPLVRIELTHVEPLKRAVIKFKLFLARIVDSYYSCKRISKHLRSSLFCHSKPSCIVQQTDKTILA